MTLTLPSSSAGAAPAGLTPGAVARARPADLRSRRRRRAPRGRRARAACRRSTRTASASSAGASARASAAVTAGAEPRLRAVVLMSGGSLPGLGLRRPDAGRAPAQVRRVADPDRPAALDGPRASGRGHAPGRPQGRRSSRGRRWSRSRRRRRSGTVVRWYPAGHELNAQAYRDQLAFLAKRLPIDGPPRERGPNRAVIDSPGGEGRRERKVVTVLFADLVGFTSRAEQLDPEDVADELGRYHGHVRAELERLRRHGREVHRRRGDGALRRADRRTRTIPSAPSEPRSRSASGRATRASRCGSASTPARRSSASTRVPRPASRWRRAT